MTSLKKSIYENISLDKYIFMQQFRYLHIAKIAIIIYLNFIRYDQIYRPV